MSTYKDSVVPPGSDQQLRSADSAASTYEYADFLIQIKNMSYTVDQEIRSNNGFLESNSFKMLYYNKLKRNSGQIRAQIQF